MLKESLKVALIHSLVSVTALAQLASPGPAIMPAKASANYGPFEWRNSHLAERLDLKHYDEKLKISSDLPASTSFVKVVFQDVQINFFAEIAKEIQLVEQNHSLLTTDLSRTKGCENHVSFVQSKLQLPATCNSLSSALAALSENIEQACQISRYPELTFKNYEQGELDEDELSTIEGLIDHAGQRFYHLTPPAVWTTDAYMTPLRQILRKVKFPLIRQQLTAKQKSYADFLRLLKTNPSCDKQSSLRKTVTALRDETNREIQDLVSLDAKGRADAEADRQKVIAQGRFRAVLPYPSLTDVERQQLSMVLGGVYWRMRGGGLSSQTHGTNDARYYYNLLPMMAIGKINGLDVGAQTGRDQNIELALHGWKDWFSMGTTPGGLDLWKSFVMMTNRGMVQVDGSSSDLSDATFDKFDYLAGGLQMGPCYFYAFQTSLKGFLINPVLPPPYRGFIDSTTAWGELCTGGALALGLSKSLLKGQASEQENTGDNFN